MASEKAKENKLLVAQCAACQKTMSVELLVGMIVRRGRRVETVPVCDACRESGWTPPDSLGG